MRFYAAKLPNYILPAFFMRSHNQKSIGIKSADRDSHGIGSPRPIHVLEKRRSKISPHSSEFYHWCSSSWKYISKRLQTNVFADSVEIFDEDSHNPNNERCGDWKLLADWNQLHGYTKRNEKMLIFVLKFDRNGFVFGILLFCMFVLSLDSFCIWLIWSTILESLTNMANTNGPNLPPWGRPSKVPNTVALKNHKLELYRSFRKRNLFEKHVNKFYIIIRSDSQVTYTKKKLILLFAGSYKRHKRPIY